ncbi:hypothetical protein E2562_007511 [Oryza meyeriana var. granulata]|uniref:Uncharacterized protein n=1 Tax=Oryza meyeriana var. granulata TaxID=110450 RepID=A0A6G1DV64_9ORYZ|nr:hypothetical protein E2562_007511 [Oryza meyeriana var. granulata]
MVASLLLCRGARKPHHVMATTAWPLERLALAAGCVMRAGAVRPAGLLGWLGCGPHRSHLISPCTKRE